jgi:DNA invertase Pin-like site-specific DNA recombinase
MMQPDRSEPPKRAAIYARSYQLKQLGGTNSVQMQIDLCKAYCVEHGYMLSEDQIYYEVKERTVDSDRPELERLRRVAQQGFIDVLVVASLERLTRNAGANPILIEQLKAIGLASEAAEKH